MQLQNYNICHFIKFRILLHLDTLSINSDGLNVFPCAVVTNGNGSDNNCHAMSELK